MSKNKKNEVMRKVRLSSMTYKEAAAVFAKKPVVLIPNGSIEEHGPQTPMGDYRISEIVADRIACATDSLVVPILPYGYSHFYRSFPGCITLAASTLAAVLYDVTRSLLEHGLDHIVYLCGHNGNMPVIEEVATKIRHEWQLITGCIETFRLFSQDFLAGVYNHPNPPVGHGGEPLTSLSLCHYPEDVRLDLMESESDKIFQGIKIAGLRQVPLGDVFGNIYVNMKDIAANGVLGDAGMASAEIGEKITEHIVERGVEFVNLFKKVDTKIK